MNPPPRAVHRPREEAMGERASRQHASGGVRNAKTPGAWRLALERRAILHVAGSPPFSRLIFAQPLYVLTQCLSMFDTERFICEIEARPPLYDVQSREYSNRDVKSKCWFEVGCAMFDKWEEFELNIKDEKVKELMKKWKAIRDCFVKDYRSTKAVTTGQAATKKKRYMYYEQLQFLLPYVKGNENTSSNIAPSSTENSFAEESIADTVEEEINKIGTPSPPPGPSTGENNIRAVRGGKRAAVERSVASSAKELNNILAASLQFQQEERRSDANGHKAFLLSFVAVLGSMPLQDSMIIRNQISQVFANYYDSTSRSHSSASNPPTNSLFENDPEYYYQTL